MADIQPLSTELVHRIAAGEVIDSPAAVVRELLDNAIDANATRIIVVLWPDDWRIQVSDNGWGLSWPDLQQAAAPHTTSKLLKGDLCAIKTLGFRGEALHSLAQVGRLEICSRSADEGWRVTYDRQGQVAAVERVAIASGTIVTVDQLFHDWPARQQSLPSPTQQLRSIQAVIHAQALCHPQMTWQVYQGDRLWFSIAPGATVQDTVPQILGTIEPGDLRYLKVPLPGRAESIEVVLGLPDRCHRQRPDWVRVAVNGRCVQVSGDDTLSTIRPLEQVILSHFRQTLPRHRYPLCFVHLSVEPAQVDWNRHPAKTDIYLRNLEQWRQQVGLVIQEMLQIPGGADRGHAQKVQQFVRVAEGKGVYQLQQAGAVAEQEGERLHELRAIAQLHQTYILAEHSSGMWLVEQHIAHERVLYEQLQRDWQVIPLTAPVMLSDLSDLQIEMLNQIGLDIELFGPRHWAVRSAPKLLALRSDCQDALLELSHCVELEPALVATACRSAIRNGTHLNLPDMQTLLDQWQRTQCPRTCPHGRPIYLSLEENSLARFFRRHWVIGKSHGI